VPQIVRTLGIPAVIGAGETLFHLWSQSSALDNCFAGSDSHWRMRMFSPAYGVAEDAATGSAAGPLAVHLVRHGLIRFGQQIEVLQGVEIGRPSTMYAKCDGTGDGIDAVEVAGSAIVIAHGRLCV
jgi:trans-2,3-dihydro-3-hydroxyanthranilate isomerase